MEVQVRRCPRCREWLQFNKFSKSKIKKHGIEYECKKCRKKRSAQYRKENRELLMWKEKERRKNNPEKIMLYAKTRYQKTKLSLAISLSTKIRRGINNSLKFGKGGRHWETLVGYSVDDLICHLKKTLPVGCTWDDYVKGVVNIHIDHIVPISAFNFKTAHDIDFRRCWGLNNLQLLPASENLLKGSKLTTPFRPSLFNIVMPWCVSTMWGVKEKRNGMV